MATDYILVWNDVALEANRVSHTDGNKEQNGPALSSRALAIVHLAMYDAYAGVPEPGVWTSRRTSSPTAGEGAEEVSCIRSGTATLGGRRKTVGLPAALSGGFIERVP